MDDRGKRGLPVERQHEVEGRTKRGRRTSSRGAAVKEMDVVQSEETEMTTARKTMPRRAAAAAPNSNGSTGSSSIADVKKRLESLLQSGSTTGLDDYLVDLQADPRDAIANLVSKALQTRAQQDEEWRRVEAMMEYENAILLINAAQVGSGSEGARSIATATTTSAAVPPMPIYIIGVDEVGVGPLAGPVVSCAVALQFPLAREKLQMLQGINDSKKLSSAKREKLSESIRRDCAVGFSLGQVSSSEVDEINVLQASLEAMKRAVLSLIQSLPPSSSPLYILVDHHTIPGLNDKQLGRMVCQTSITKGDCKSITIAAASVIAKVFRDDYMTRLHSQFPHFGFDRNAGYGTSQHLVQLRKGLFCPEHRFSFEPVRLAKRKAMGLPPDVSPKKQRSRTASASPKKRQKQMPDDSERAKRAIEEVEPATSETTSRPVTSPPPPPPPAIFSLRWWSSWFPSPSSSGLT